MKILIISVTLIICSYFISIGFMEASRWSTMIDLNKERESSNVVQTLEIHFLSKVLFELEEGDQSLGIKRLKEHIENNNNMLKKELADEYLSENAINIINDHLKTDAKGFEQDETIN